MNEALLAVSFNDVALPGAPGPLAWLRRVQTLFVGGRRRRIKLIVSDDEDMDWSSWEYDDRLTREVVLR